LHPPSDLVGSTGFAVLTPSKYPWAFVHAAATRPEIFEELGRLADGGAYPAVRGEVVAAQPVVIPGVAVAIAYQEAAGPLFGRVAANEVENVTLSQIRDALLPKLLSGELRVRDADRIVEQAV
jgi:type I restriction enzyme S subunit